ncbi:MAG: hypothetical protein Q4C79_01630 [Neisseria sp.]|nr:hypothetical protein [Neisseria sp.]MDO4247662.1 hypothetical protein [Neisseria sp.]
MNRNLLSSLFILFLLSACAASGNGNSHTEAYGQISGGIETSRTR